MRPPAGGSLTLRLHVSSSRHPARHGPDGHGGEGEGGEGIGSPG